MDASGPGQGSGVPSSRRFIITAFALMAAGTVAATLVAVGQTRLLDSNVRHLVDNMLTSIRIVGQLEDEVDDRRALVAHHIDSKDAREMAAIDGRLGGRLGALHASIAHRLETYEPWIDLPGERDVWEHTRADVAALDLPITRALALSRENSDDEARVVLDELAPQYTRINKDIDRVVAINERGASQSLAGFAQVRNRLIVILLGIGVAALAGTLLLGRWALGQTTRREDELADAARRLEARNSELDAFAGRVAHDIRNPLAAASFALAPLAAKLPSDDRALQALRRGMGRIEALVEDLLALARVESIAQGRCDPANVVTEVARELEPRLEAERGTLEVAVEPATVACSEGLLRQALTNLLDNAVKYRRPDVTPRVKITGTPTDGRYELRVSDNGVGMSPDDTRHVFEPFFRAPLTRDLPGTGLGLAIVSRVVEASQGTVTVDSTLGQGSTFVVRLPLTVGPLG
jgi:signal transduction histidine kinase